MLPRYLALFALLLALPASASTLEPYDIRYPLGVKGIPPGASSDSLFGFVTSNLTLTSAAPGPVWHVIGDLYVQPGVTLTIESGVTVLFQSNSDLLNSGDYFNHSELIVRGTLVANGAIDDSARFASSSGTAGSWGQIKLEPGSTGSFNYCSLRDANRGFYVGTTSFFGSGNSMRNSWVGINTYGTSASIRGWRLDGIAEGVRSQSDAVVLRDLTIYRSATNGILVDPSIQILIENCVVAKCGTGLRINTSSCAVNVLVSYCTFDSNGTGVYNWYSCQSPRIRNSIISRTVGNAIVGQNGPPWGVDYCDVWSYGGVVGAVLDTGVVAINPLYVNASGNDYHLRSISPCRTLGEGGTQMGAYGPSGAVSGVGGGSTAHAVLALLPNVPNPFKSQTLLRFTLSRPTDVRISVFDVQGRTVTQFDRSLDRGLQEISWTAVRDDGRPVADGVYFYRVEGQGEVRRGQLVVSR